MWLSQSKTGKFFFRPLALYDMTTLPDLYHHIFLAGHALTLSLTQSFGFQEISHDAVNFVRLGVKVAVPLARKDDELGIWNILGEDISTRAMRHITDNEVIVVSHKDQGGYFDVA